MSEYTLAVCSMSFSHFYFQTTLLSYLGDIQRMELDSLQPCPSTPRFPQDCIRPTSLGYSIASRVW